MNHYPDYRSLIIQVFRRRDNYINPNLLRTNFWEMTRLARNRLENPRTISAPGSTEYKQKCYFFIYYFFNFISVCVYKANKGVVVVVVVVSKPSIGKV